MNAVLTMNIILASSSPRRQDILSRLGFDYAVIHPQLNEQQLPGEKPAEHVLRLSREKALQIARNKSSDLVIGADTIVVLNDLILGKPDSPDNAFAMLSLLSGKEHTVYTGLSLVVLERNIINSDYDATRVTFNELRPTDIRDYIASGEPLDKAGAYGIQGMGSFLVHHYEGEFDTVIGFPSRLFARMYEEVSSCLNH